MTHWELTAAPNYTLLNPAGGSIRVTWLDRMRSRYISLHFLQLLYLNFSLCEMLWWLTVSCCSISLYGSQATNWHFLRYSVWCPNNADSITSTVCLHYKSLGCCVTTCMWYPKRWTCPISTESHYTQLFFTPYIDEEVTIVEDIL